MRLQMDTARCRAAECRGPAPDVSAMGPETEGRLEAELRGDRQAGKITDYAAAGTPHI
jgi:hypothetical protein